jgi:hypothetical protein
MLSEEAILGAMYLFSFRWGEVFQQGGDHGDCLLTVCELSNIVNYTT